MGGGSGTTPRNNIGRFNPDGSLDMGFDPGANEAVFALALQPDGKVVAGGGFTMLGGGGSGTTYRSYFGRLSNPDAAVQALTVASSGNTVTWQRGGSSPELWRVTFASSTDGSTYAPLGEGVRVTGGWELGGLNLPKNQHLFIRAQGSYATGFANADGSMTESVRFAWLAAGGSGGDIITTVAGTGTAAYSGDGGPATAAAVQYPFDVAVDAAGNVYLTDHINHRIRKVWASNGTITTVAGTGVQGSSGDGGPATAAQINTPTGIGLDSSGNLYIADYSACVVRKVTAATGLISTVAGSGTCGFNGDGLVGPATWLNNPYDIAVDSAGNLYIADFMNSRIRKVAASGGTVTTFAGTGGFGYGGDGGQAIWATFNSPTYLAVDGSSLYIADTNNYRVRKVQLASGIIVTAAGTGIQGFSGDGGPASAAKLSLPFGLAVDAAGNLFIADEFNHRIRRVAGATGVITTVAGTGTAGFGGDGGPATAAALNYPQGVAVDAAGLLYIADTQNNRIRKVGPALSRHGRGDFTGDLKSDILWRHASGGDVWLWPMDGASRTSETHVRTVADTNWEIRGQGDQDGNGMADILWRNKVTGQIYFWPMDGTTPLAEQYVATVDTAYDIVGAGDFDGDGRSDILWRNTAAGDVWIWLMDGATPLAEVYVDTVDPSYQVKGVGDLDGDTKADIVWQGAAGDVWVWLMNGTARVSENYAMTVADPHYEIQQVADFDGNGKDDILWWNMAHGDVWIWPMNGPTVLAETYVGMVPDTGYRIVGTGDYNGDGMADILWRHAALGEVWVWLMNGFTKQSETYVGTVPDLGYEILTGARRATTNIAFSGLTAYGSPLGIYTESGFTVTADSTDWVANSYGAPGPAIVFYGSDGTTLTREVSVTAAGRTFSFVAVDLYSSITQIPYEIIGLRNSVAVFSMTGTVPNTYGNFRTVAHPTGLDTIDTLVVRLSNPAYNPMGLDNIVLRR